MYRKSHKRKKYSISYSYVIQANMTTNRMAQGTELKQVLFVINSSKRNSGNSCLIIKSKILCNKWVRL